VASRVLIPGADASARRKLTFGSARFSVPRRATKRTRLRLSKRARRLAAARRRTRVVATLTATANATTKTTRRRLTGRPHDLLALLPKMVSGDVRRVKSETGSKPAVASYATHLPYLDGFSPAYEGVPAEAAVGTAAAAATVTARRAVKRRMWAPLVLVVTEPRA
jgi:hypothetical protein